VDAEWEYFVNIGQVGVTCDSCGQGHDDAITENKSRVESNRVDSHPCRVESNRVDSHPCLSTHRTRPTHDAGGLPLGAPRGHPTVPGRGGARREQLHLLLGHQRARLLRAVGAPPRARVARLCRHVRRPHRGDGGGRAPSTDGALRCLALFALLACLRATPASIHIANQPPSPTATRQEYRFYKSLQQTVLSRAFVRYAVESAASRRLLLHLATSQAPDEIFFPTLLHLPEAASHRER
jgi:hypothetical protein